MISIIIQPMPFLNLFKTEIRASNYCLSGLATIMTNKVLWPPSPKKHISSGKVELKSLRLVATQQIVWIEGSLCSANQDLVSSVHNYKTSYHTMYSQYPHTYQYHHYLIMATKASMENFSLSRIISSTLKLFIKVTKLIYLCCFIE